MTADSASQKWTRITVEPELLRTLMQREDARPLRDMMVWLGLMAVCRSYNTNLGQLVGNHTAICLCCVI